MFETLTRLVDTALCLALVMQQIVNFKFKEEKKRLLICKSSLKSWDVISLFKARMINQDILWRGKIGTEHGRVISMHWTICTQKRGKIRAVSNS